MRVDCMFTLPLNLFHVTSSIANTHPWPQPNNNVVQQFQKRAKTFWFLAKVSAFYSFLFQAFFFEWFTNEDYKTLKTSYEIAWSHQKQPEKLYKISQTFKNMLQLCLFFNHIKIYKFSYRFGNTKDCHLK